MKVILLEDIENIGKKYDVKDVKEGYARNFLLPKKLIKPATKQNLAWLAKERESLEVKAEENLKQVQELASTIDGIEVPISVKVGEGGQLFESVNAVKIAEQLKKMGFDVKKNQIKLEEPIKEAGEFPVKLQLEHNLEAEIRIMVTGDSYNEE